MRACRTVNENKVRMVASCDVGVVRIAYSGGLFGLLIQTAYSNRLLNHRLGVAVNHCLDPFEQLLPANESIVSNHIHGRQATALDEGVAATGGVGPAHFTNAIA